MTGTPTAALTRLSSPYDVVIDGNFYVYVADYNNNRILRFPPGKSFKINFVIEFL